MKRYLIVSTYPEHGSKNIGDHLITQSLIKAIKHVKGEGASFDVVFREEKWAVVEPLLEGCAGVVFACLAIRDNMAEKEYPFLAKVLERDIPISVIAAGTAVNLAGSKIAFNFTQQTIDLLRALDKRACVFTTRDYLTQTICRRLGLTNTSFSGDIAFFSGSSGSRFDVNGAIRRIVVSDPHRHNIFKDSFCVVIRGLKQLFPGAEVVVALHGVNPGVEETAKDLSVPFRRIYENRENGLDFYNDVDLHVGFRVHAHVSALGRRKLSYLIEQDGRGAGYGLTINGRVSTPSFYRPPATIVDRVRRKIGMRARDVGVSTVPAELTLSLIENDRDSNFKKFLHLESQLNEFDQNIIGSIAKIR
ncbi:polysaccharide pyruvyl transferase family protein [Bordetella petrii]|uniref:Polysaccharide pyruvyl transferase domain-containing protein n=1 Tax=Bordetella petrii (strain ATCC BAA-461 / DSM 12804 / CCUG 43448 / CIP 107267 / Se-1111R) TaxID=340100 RepID=A9I975_BORPD|nr:polysaccharide pyruvyl transferase family protein [Bordetella petrii]CAP41337.1 conserved hypothetical protein [Bordetella petrii]